MSKIALYVGSIVIPLLIVGAGGYARRIVRGGGSRWQDFYLGVELNLAALAAALSYLSRFPELMGRVDADALGYSMFALCIYLVLVFGLLLWNLSEHQKWKVADGAQPGNPSRAEIIRLAIISNLIGAGLFSCFELIVKCDPLPGTNGVIEGATDGTGLKTELHRKPGVEYSRTSTHARKEEYGPSRGSR